MHPLNNTQFPVHPLPPSPLRNLNTPVMSSLVDVFQFLYYKRAMKFTSYYGHKSLETYHQWLQIWQTPVSVIPQGTRRYLSGGVPSISRRIKGGSLSYGKTDSGVVKFEAIL